MQGDFFLKINKRACTSIRYTRVRVDFEESLPNCHICITVFNYTVPLRPWTFLAEPPATVQSPLSKLVRLATEFEAPLCIAVKKLREKSLKSCMVCIKVA